MQAGNDRPTASEPPAGNSGVGPETALRAENCIEQRAGETIGPYKLLEVIGEGGFGVVWLAEQSGPVRRRVALKVIKPGMDSKAVIARFEAERQALAMMGHPNVAKVLDAGTTPATSSGGGRPYFVMEHVKGSPITDYCDKHRLTVEQRLKLFAIVCDAVQHAHMKGIIHRDLKPSNILVTIADSGEARPVVIDFGVAKALAGRLTEQTIYTERGVLIGTPEYMSPEQAEMAETDIDTRTDVYSLGVILYELLTGAVPFDAKTLRAAGVAAIQKMIREADPPRPSTRLSTLGEANTAVAAARQVALNDLASRLRRELEWIPLKAIRKDRAERYRSASELADDVGNYLAHRPLIAGPESTGYKMRKFVRRNKGAVAAVGAIVATLVLAAGVSVWFGLSEAAQRQAAEAAKAEAQREKEEAKKQEAEARKQEAEAKNQAAIAEAVAKFQTDMLATADPGKLMGENVTVLQAMRAAVKVLDAGSLKDEPLVEASVRDTIGNTLRTLGSLRSLEEAEPNLRKSLVIRRAALPAGHPDIAASLNDLAELLRAQNKLAEAEPLFREALRIWRAALPAEHPSIAAGLNGLALLLRAQNKPAEAEPLFREAIQIYRAALPAGHQDIAHNLSNLALLLQDQNKLAEAEPLFREAVQILRAGLPAGHPNIAIGLSSLAGLLRAQNKLAEAEPLYREALEIDRGALPAGHPSIAVELNNLALDLQEQNKLAEAEPLHREALQIRRASLPGGHPDIANSLNNLALLLQYQNKPAEAEQLFREALQIRRASLPAGHPHIALSLNNLASLLQGENKLAEAEPLYREALEMRRAAFPAGHPDIANALNNLASLLQAQNKPAEAEPLLEEALQILRASRPAGHPNIAAVRSNLARVQQALGKSVEARAGFDEAIAILDKGPPQGSPLLARTLWRSGTARLENKDPGAALPEFERAVAMAEKLLPPDHPQLKEYRETLAKCKAALGK